MYLECSIEKLMIIMEQVLKIFLCYDLIKERYSCSPGLLAELLLSQLLYSVHLMAMKNHHFLSASFPVSISVYAAGPPTR